MNSQRHLFETWWRSEVRAEGVAIAWNGWKAALAANAEASVVIADKEAHEEATTSVKFYCPMCKHKQPRTGTSTRMIDGIKRRVCYIHGRRF